MNALLRQLWNDEQGFVVSAELVIVSTVLVTGLTVGLSYVRDGLTGEFKEIGDAFRSLDQTYYYSGFQGCRQSNNRPMSFVSGSRFCNRKQGCDDLFPKSDIAAASTCRPCQTQPLESTIVPQRVSHQAPQPAPPKRRRVAPLLVSEDDCCDPIVPRTVFTPIYRPEWTWNGYRPYRRCCPRRMRGRRPMVWPSPIPEPASRVLTPLEPEPAVREDVPTRTIWAK